MLRTNLASKPFYNDRGIRLGIVAGVLIVAALTTFNGLQILTLNRRSGELTAREQAARVATAQFREKARITTTALDRKEIDAVQAFAREANKLIDRRAFSWTDLFNRFEETLPPDVRIAAVQPQIDDDGVMLVAVTALARRTEDLHAFLDQLEATGAFREVIARSQSTTEEGLLLAIIQGYYGPTSPEATVPGSATSDINGSSGNRSSSNATPAVGNASPASPRGPQ
jgi:hypothetical protein